jgi:hypothetical protein
MTRADERVPERGARLGEEAGRPTSESRSAERASARRQ